jgi:hypothetical protein
MKLLKVYFDHIKMFEDGVLNIDLYASDKVPVADESVSELRGSLYTHNIIALAGINASGKTTVLTLLRVAQEIVNGRPLGRSELPRAVSTLFSGNPTFKCLLWDEGQAYYLVSRLLCSASGLTFAEETVGLVPLGSLKRATLASWNALDSSATVMGMRSTLKTAATPFLLEDMSMASAFFGTSSDHKIKMLVSDDMRAYPSATFPGLDETLKVFDPSIESLAIEDSGRAFTLKFLGREPMTLSHEGLSEVLSSGTEQGLRLVRCATEILRCGGYLLIDEIENHLNRQLVNVLLDLFDSHSTNPHGATLVFTTHYSQLLDHVHRKDNVYFLAKSDPGFSRIVKYGDVVSRIENKKSEVFSSNYIKGTAPRYADVKALTSVIESQVRANG